MDRPGFTGDAVTRNLRGFCGSAPHGNFEHVDNLANGLRAESSLRRIGTFRGIRAGKSDFGATAFGTKGIQTVQRASAYPELCTEIAKFFLTHEPPVSEAETIEIFAFMEAADESKRQGGAPVDLVDVISKALQQNTK